MNRNTISYTKENKINKKTKILRKRLRKSQSKRKNKSNIFSKVGGGIASSIPIEDNSIEDNSYTLAVNKNVDKNVKVPSNWKEVVEKIHNRARQLGVDYERASNVAQLRWTETNKGGIRGCKNIEDPVTLEKFGRSDFEELNLRKLPSGYCYKVDTLLQLEKWEDPLTRDKLPEKWDDVFSVSVPIESSDVETNINTNISRNRNAFMHGGADNEPRTLRDITNVTQNDEYVLQTPKKRTSYWSSIGESPKIKSSNVGADVIGGLLS